MNEIWLAIEPYVFGVLGALGGGGFVYWIVRSLVRRWLKGIIRIDVSELVNVKLSGMQDKMENLAVIVADVGEVFSRSKTLTGTEKERLVRDISAIRGTCARKSEKKKEADEVKDEKKKDIIFYS